MAEPLSLSLQAFPLVDQDKESLQYLIRRINEQKGSFRNVTEQSLEEEIHALEAGETQPDDGDVVETVEEAEDPKAKREEVSKARDEILKQVAQSYTESAMTLDFVSLLLSKHVPAPAQSTISPYLRQTLPLGSLGADIGQAPQVSDIEKHNQEMVSIGWRMQSLSGAADSLLKSASRLEGEIGRETAYWNQVLAVKEKGWPLCRLPREKHTLGVRYGFAEAYSDFRDRGLAALRRDEDGNISLDRGVRSPGDQTLRVRILQKGEPIASSTGGTVKSLDDNSVEQTILRARNSIFDEELYREIYREARNLISQSVRCAGGSILIPYETDKQIEINLVSLEDGASEASNGTDTVAEATALSLRVLLSYAHRQNLRNRSQPPQPTRESRAPRRMYAILKPVTEYLQHRSHVESTKAFLKGFAATLTSAGLGKMTSKAESSLDFSLLCSKVAEQNTSAVETLLQALTSSQHTSMDLHLLHGNTSVKVDINTQVLAPTFGTTYQTTISESANSIVASEIPPTMQHRSQSAFEKHILHLCTINILDILSKSSKGWSIFPRIYQMTRTKPGSTRDTVTVSLSNGQLSISWHQLSRLADQPKTWIWHSAEDVQGEKRKLVDVFKYEIDAK